MVVRYGLTRAEVAGPNPAIHIDLLSIKHSAAVDLSFLDYEIVTRNAVRDHASPV